MSGPIEAALGRADDRLRAARTRQAGARLDPRMAAALASVTGEDAPLAARAVAEKVRGGVLTWDDLWLDPHAHGPEAVRVVQSALVDLARRVREECPPP